MIISFINFRTTTNGNLEYEIYVQFAQCPFSVHLRSKMQKSRFCHIHDNVNTNLCYYESKEIHLIQLPIVCSYSCCVQSLLLRAIIRICSHGLTIYSQVQLAIVKLHRTTECDPPLQLFRYQKEAALVIDNKIWPLLNLHTHFKSSTQVYLMVHIQYIAHSITQQRLPMVIYRFLCVQ